MKKIQKQLGICVLGMIIHVLTLVWYISGKLYPGVYVIGIESGIVAAAEVMLFLLSFREYAREGIHWETILLTVLSALGAVFSGYCFIIWGLLFL